MTPPPRRSGAAAPRTIGVDTGGTFTDLCIRDESGLRTEKLPSTPNDPSEAVLDGIDSLGGAASGTHVIHGTTVALNALLTGRSARTALVTNEGFGDLIEIGRQERPDLYALHPARTPPLVPTSLRFEVDQRSWPRLDSDTNKGPGLETIQTPSPRALEHLRSQLAEAGVESIAVCLLHSYADPGLEQDIAKALAPLDIPITCSAQLLQEYREFERFSTAVSNAALVPLVRDYVERLRARIPDARLSLLQSNGGTLPAERAALEPVRILLSGPAGGVVGAARAAADAGFPRMVGLDMGGTSTDVAFHDTRQDHGAPGSQASVAGHPIGVPSLDIHTIGCGGGSIVHVDDAGVLRVGPESAGADPGPVCYGKSDRPTVTDAHVMLGHVAPGTFLGGRLELDVDGVTRAFETLGKRLGVRAHEAAEGVLEVARAAMRRAVGVMTMQRGQDPKGLPLVAFGGAGGLHGAAVAASLGMQGALIPAHPGVLSALGMASADALREHSRSVLAPLDRWSTQDRKRALDELIRRGRDELREEGHPPRSIDLERMLDLRYQGQSFEIRIAEGPRAAERFHAEHERRYGYRLEDRPLELVHLRTRAIARRAEAEHENPRKRKLPTSAILGHRKARFGAGLQPTPRIDRARLLPGHHFQGPALVEEFSGSTVVPPGTNAQVTAGGHLLIRRT